MIYRNEDLGFTFDLITCFLDAFGRVCKTVVRGMVSKTQKAWIQIKHCSVDVWPLINK